MSKTTLTKSSDQSKFIELSPSMHHVVVQSHRDSGSIKWRVLSSCRQLVTDEKSPDWFHLIESDRIKLIKRGQGRMVWRVNLGQDTVFVKVITASRWLDRIKIFLIGTQAKREWKAICSAKEKEVHTVDGLAVGIEQSGMRRSVLVTRAFHEAVDLRCFWMELQRQCQLLGRSLGQENDLAVSLGKFIAESHRQGFVHRDLHPANILVRKDASGTFEFRFVDLLGSKTTGRALGRSAAIRSLSQLYQFFSRISSRTLRLRFLRAYVSQLGLIRGHADISRLCRAWGQSVESNAVRVALALSQQRDRRLVRIGKYFTPIRITDGWQGNVTLTLGRRHIFPEHEVEDHNKQAWLAMLRDILPKLTGYGGNDGILELGGVDYKWRRAKGIVERWRWTWFGSPAKRAFLACHRMRHRGQYAPLVMGYVQHNSYKLVDMCVTFHPVGQKKAI